MKSAGDHKLTFWLIFCLPTLWILIFLLVPILMIGIFSFSEKQGLIDITASWNVDNYIRSFDPVYLLVLFKSVWIAILTTLICFLVGFPLAIGIASAPKSWKFVLLMIVILPFWVNLLIRTYALIAVFRTKGFLNFSLEGHLQLHLIYLKGLNQVFSLELGIQGHQI